MPRKTTGCWTCRARKKKCDDGQPTCYSCTVRSITCFGYGAKPEWFDGSHKERAMMQSIKLQTKESYRQRRLQRSRANRVDSFHHVSSTVTSPSVELPASALWTQFDGPNYDDCSSDTSSSREIDLNESQHGSEIYDMQSTTNTTAPLSPMTSCSDSSFMYSERELTLVMYYFDHIFPRLCPFFTYSAEDNGRGWLLTLFLRTKPLCAAAVCLSACDKAQFVLGPLSDTPEHSHHDLELQHIHIVADLRRHLSKLSKRSHRLMAEAVEALACIVHLILFELWIPRKELQNDWVMHLDAANALLASVAFRLPDNAISSLPASTSAESFHHGEIGCHFPIETLSDGEKAAFDFYLTTYAYCFINSAASLGLTPHSIQSVQRIRLIYHEKQSRLKGMLGCEDSVMVALLDIASLKEWKQRMQKGGTLSFRELTRRADLIEERLNAIIANLSSRKIVTKTFKEQEQDMITSIYVYSSLVFLHSVVSGMYPNLPEIQQNVLCTLEALEHMRKHSAVNFPSWPFCISGCLALKSEYSRFRALSPLPKKGQHPLVVTTWALNIIEECWRVRETQEEGTEIRDWVTAMNHLGTRLLLV